MSCQASLKLDLDHHQQIKWANIFTNFEKYFQALKSLNTQINDTVFNVSTAESSDSSAVFKPYKPAKYDSTSTTLTTSTTSTTSSSTSHVKPAQQIDLDSLDMDGLVTDYHPDL